MCTAVRIVVAAAERERRLELRRAAVTAEWEVVGEVAGVDATVAIGDLDGLRDTMRDLLHESGDHQHA